jgi:hypothetical protein
VAAGLLRKDVEITVALAQTAGVVPPETLVDLTERTLAALEARA